MTPTRTQSTLLALAVSAGLAGSAAAQDIKIGVLAPFTGPFTGIGQNVKTALELSTKEINDAGGVLGRKLVLVYEDGESNPAVATQRAEKLFQVDKVDFLTGTVHSGVTLAVGQVAERNNRILTTTVSFSNAITGSGCSPNVFRVNPSAAMQASALAVWVSQAKKGAKIYYAGPDYEMGRSTIAEFKKEAEKLGAANAGELYAPLNAKDFSQYFGQIRAAKPDMLYISTAGTDSTRLLTQLVEYGVTGFQLIGSSGAVTTENMAAMGKAAENFVTSGGYSTFLDTPANKVFVEKFKAAAKLEPNLYAADTYGVLPFSRRRPRRPSRSRPTSCVRPCAAWAGTPCRAGRRCGPATIRR